MSRTGAIGQHVARRPVLDGLVVVLEQADDEARERMSVWLGAGRVLSWPEIKREATRLRELEVQLEHREDMRAAMARRQARTAGRLDLEPVIVDGEELG